ncbi:transcriptional regulatory [Fusarium heterosporum]|uniref:Transcriptional regulatory n=1 Tax=Fusarium heterosporum TaxID=42747 RepID=A0A8H5WEY6_FUSHE|nr:transcriptional regulatory [Fusarium heterosporum]
MVTPNCYSTDVRRYGNRMSLYSSYPERRGAYNVHPDTRTTVLGDRDDDVTPQRKRIAVARANNSISVGVVERGRFAAAVILATEGHVPIARTPATSHASFSDVDQVASQETPMKNESFNYSLEASRQYQARGSSNMPSMPSATQTYPGGLPPYTSDSLVYRTPSAFGYGAKQYCPLSSWSQGYTDDQSYNYALYQPSFQSVHDADYGIGYRIASGTSNKSALCVDTEPNYAYSSGNSVPNLVHRPAQGTVESTNLGFQNMVSDSKSLAFQSMAASVNVGDRVLPVPVGRSTIPGSIGSSYKNDSSSPSYSGSSGKSSQASTSETSPASSTSETPSSYTSYESLSMTSASSCVPSYPPITLASQFGRSSNDLYSHTGSSEAAMFTPTDSMRHGPDMTYRYEDTTAAVTAAAVSSTTSRDLPNLNGSGIGSFSMGHSATHCLPHQPAPYMLSAGDLGSVGTDTVSESYRKSAGGLRA